MNQILLQKVQTYQSQLKILEDKMLKIDKKYTALEAENNELRSQNALLSEGIFSRFPMNVRK